VSYWTSLHEYCKEYPHYALCRDLAHVWDLTEVSMDGGHYLRHLTCSRCGTVRQQKINAYGELLQNKYQYPDHYTIPEAGRMTKADRATLRRAMLRAEIERPTAITTPPIRRLA
jgi:hypothetical protein